MSAVGITENVKGDIKKFEIWYSGREVVYIVQVSTFVSPFSCSQVVAQSFSVSTFSSLADSPVLAL